MLCTLWKLHIRCIPINRIIAVRLQDLINNKGTCRDDKGDKYTNDICIVTIDRYNIVIS